MEVDKSLTIDELYNPVIFIKEKTTHYYENNFFNDSTLEELYGVSFNSLAVKYD